MASRCRSCAPPVPRHPRRPRVEGEAVGFQSFSRGAGTHLNVKRREGKCRGKEKNLRAEGRGRFCDRLFHRDISEKCQKSSRSVYTQAEEQLAKETHQVAGVGLGGGGFPEEVGGGKNYCSCWLGMQCARVMRHFWHWVIMVYADCTYWHESF